MAARPNNDALYLDRIAYGDCRTVLRDMIGSGFRVDCVVTSPPYWGLRDYGADGQLGLEASLEAYIAAQADVFDLIRLLLNKRGTVWLNLGDAYVAQRKGSESEESSTLTKGVKRSHAQNFFVRYAKRTWLGRKNLIGLPWHLAFALQNRGWILRDCIIWQKPNPLPESVKDRTTKAHEYLFMLARQPSYYYDAKAIAELRATEIDKPVGGWAAGDGDHDAVDHNRPLQGTLPDGDKMGRKYAYKAGGKARATGKRRNAHSVWAIPTEPYKGAHYATFPQRLVQRCILAGCPPGGVAFDPYMGTGTVAAIAKMLGRHYSGIELNEAEYGPQIDKRLADAAGGMQL